MKKLYASVIPSFLDGKLSFAVEVTMENGSKATFFFGDEKQTQTWLDSRKQKYDLVLNWLY